LSSAISGQAALVVLHEVADDLDASELQRRDVATQHVEVALEVGIGRQMHARLNDGLAAALGFQPNFHRIEDLLVRHRQCFDVGAVEPSEMDRSHGHTPPPSPASR
jgi:hypothetical protein